MIFDRGIRKAAGQTPASGLLTLDSARGWEGWLDADNAGLSRDKAMKLSAVDRCVEIRACTVAMLPTYVMNETAKTRLRDHPLSDVLRGQPNEFMTRFDYERLMQCNLDLRGNAYAYISRDSRTGRPKELIPMDPDLVTPYVPPDGSLWYVYTHPRTGEMLRLHPADVLHYKGYSSDGIEGISILRRASLSIRTGLSAQEYQKSIYQNGGRPSGILTVEADLDGMGNLTITNDQGEEEVISRKEKIRREWDKMYSGPGNGFKTAIVDNGLKYQPLSITNSEAQFVESEELRVADVCRHFGVPLHMVYAGKQSYNSNEQNSIEFCQYTIQPIVTQREQEDSRKLLLPSQRADGQRIKRELKALLRGDTAAQSAWYRAMREIGVYSADDIRALEDLPDVPGGQTRYASWNYGPLEQFAELSVLRAMGGKTEETEGKPHA